MGFREREIDFQEADRRYAELKLQRDVGTISDEEFDAQRRQLMVQDEEGRWWAKSLKTGGWNYHDGNTWRRGTPPGYQPSPTPPAKSTPDRQSQFEQGEQSSSPRTSLPGAAPVQDQNGEKRRRGVPRGVAAGAGLLAVVLVVASISYWLLVPDGSDGVGPSSEETPGAEPGYTLFEHDSRALSVEVPSEWDERVVVDEEGEKGRSSWSSFLGEGESAGPSITAVNDLSAWRNGTSGHQGIYMVASKSLAQGYTDDELVTSGPNDYSSSCEAGTPQDVEWTPYSGKTLVWNDCGGDGSHIAITLALAPEGRECVLVAQIGGYFREAEKENLKHILETLKIDCSRID